MHEWIIKQTNQPTKPNQTKLTNQLTNKVKQNKETNK